MQIFFSSVFLTTPEPTIVALPEFFLVAYFCHHLSDNYVDLPDLYVVLSDLYVDFSLIHLLENESKKRVLAQLMPYR